MAAGAVREPNVNTLPPESADIVRASYSTSIGFVFLVMTVVIAFAVLCTALLQETPLRTRRDQIDIVAKETADADAAAGDAAAEPADDDPVCVSSR